MSTEAGSEDLSKQKHSVTFQSLMNYYYHENMERKYSSLINSTTFISIVFSSASFAAIGSLIPGVFAPHRDIMVAVLAFSVTCLNSIVLAFGVLHKGLDNFREDFLSVK